MVRERLEVALQMVSVEQARTWVGLAGTMTTLSALAQNMMTYDAAAIHLSRVRGSDLMEVCDRLIGMTRVQRVALPSMHASRADVIGGGAVLVQELVRELRTWAGIDELIVSERDILDGIVLSIAG